MLATSNRDALTAAGGRPGDAVASGPLFPVLKERINDVAQVTVTGPDGSFTVERSGDRWGAKDKGGYPVDFGQVRPFVLGVAGFDVVEAMTSNPDYHHRLGLEEPGSAPSEDEPSASKRLTLKDAEGEVLADVIVGQARATQGRGQPCLYARRAGEDQTYEVTGRLSVDTSPTRWLDRKVLELKQERVEEVTITHPDGEVLRISRPSADQASFDVQGLPEGRELVWDGVARSIATAAQNLTLEDVGRELVDFEALETTTAEFRTFGGLVITATTAEQDETTYLQIEARVDEAAGPPLPEPAATDDEAGDSTDETDADGDASEQAGEFDDDPAEDDEPAPLPTPEELQAEADAINARVAGWTYVVPGWAASNLRKRMDELLKPLEPAGTPPGAPTDADGADLPMLDTQGEELPPELQQAIQEALKNSESGGVVPPSEQIPPAADEEPEPSPPAEDDPADDDEASPDDTGAADTPDDGARLAG
jgi:hypothetical protein